MLVLRGNLFPSIVDPQYIGPLDPVRATHDRATMRDPAMRRLPRLNLPTRIAPLDIRSCRTVVAAQIRSSPLPVSARRLPWQHFPAVGQEVDLRELSTGIAAGKRRKPLRSWMPVLALHDLKEVERNLGRRDKDEHRFGAGIPNIRGLPPAVRGLREGLFPTEIIPLDERCIRSVRASHKRACPLWAGVRRLRRDDLPSAIVPENESGDRTVIALQGMAPE